MNATTTERKPLTEIQAKVLAYLVKCVELEDRIPPNHVIAKDFGWASPTAANEHLHAIERKGWLTRTHYGALMLADRPVLAPVFIGVDSATVSDETVIALRDYSKSPSAMQLMSYPTAKAQPSNPEMKTPATDLRSHVQKNLAAMHTHIQSLIACVADDDAEYSLELCSNLMSQTRGLQQMLEAAIARGIDIDPEVAHG